MIAFPVYMSVLLGGLPSLVWKYVFIDATDQLCSAGHLAQLAFEKSHSNPVRERPSPLPDLRGLAALRSEMLVAFGGSAVKVLVIWGMGITSVSVLPKSWVEVNELRWG